MTVVGTFYRLGVMAPLMLVIYAYAGLIIVQHVEKLTSILPVACLLFLLPAICFMSTLWSVEPLATLKNSVQYLYSGVIGVALGLRYSLRTLLVSLAIAMVLCVLISVANIFLEIVPAYKEDDYVGAERYLLGVYPQKNMLGNVLFLCALGLAYLGLIWRKSILMYLPMICLLPLLLEAKSTTALLFYLATLSIPFAWWFLTKLEYKIVWIVAGIVLLSTLLFVAIVLEIALIDEFLGAFGKERTLTGRTVIWATAFDVFEKRPWLGVGYQAFWNAPVFVPEVQLIRAAVLESISGFHNGHLEILVATGMFGLSAYWILIISVLAVCTRDLLIEMRPGTLIVFYYVGLTTLKSFTESALCYQHDIDYLLYCAILVASVLRRADRTTESFSATADKTSVLAVKKA